MYVRVSAVICFGRNRSSTSYNAFVYKTQKGYINLCILDENLLRSKRVAAIKYTYFFVSIIIAVVITYKYSGVGSLERSMCLVNHSICIDKNVNI